VPQAADAAGSSGERSGVDPPRGRARGRVLAIVGLVLVVAVVVVIATDPFGGSGKSTGGVVDNASAVSLVSVKRQSLSQQTQVSGTLGYAGSSSIRVPSGTAPSAVSQAEQSVTNAQGMLNTARVSLAADSEALAGHQATVSAARAKEAVDCAGDGAAEAASANSSPGGESTPGGSSPSGSSSGPCASDVQAVSSAQQNATSTAAKVTADSSQVSSAEKQLASAQSNLSTARSSETVYGQTSTFTKLPSVGQVISRGQTLYAISGRPVVLLYGSPATRRLPLGSVVFHPGPVRVTSVTPTVGQAVMPGPVLAITSIARQVKIALDASQQASVKVGDQVTITLPDNQTTPGRISYVSSVATTPSSSGKGGEEESAPTIEVDATPTDPGATGHLDQAPVNVEITTERVENVLAVPVDALLALAGGGYAVEVAEGGVHRLEAVTVGLFDDAEGVVQVSGQGLSAGQRVVVPQTS
jgi:multidrug efflux pump subunit AcrA (membrane-fusion protein)